MTICCYDKIYRFGNVVKGQMILNAYGELASDLWMFLPERYEGIALGEFVIMPNHMHGIIVFDDELGLNPAKDREIHAALSSSLPIPNRTPLPNHSFPVMENIPKSKLSRRLGDVIGGYKSLVSNACLELYKEEDEWMGKMWQRNYWEEIIWDDQAFINISHYIIRNPRNWSEDDFFLG